MVAGRGPLPPPPSPWLSPAGRSWASQCACSKPEGPKPTHAPLPGTRRHPAPLRGLGLPRCCHQSRPPASFASWCLASSVGVPPQYPLTRHASASDARPSRSFGDSAASPPRGFPSIGLRLVRPLPLIAPKSKSLRPERANVQIPFRPRGLSPPRRFSPDSRCRHCCSLLPIMGFTAFPFAAACTNHIRRHGPSARHRTFPRCVHPSKNFPPTVPSALTTFIQRVQCSRAASASMPLLVVATLAGSDSLHRRHSRSPFSPHLTRLRGFILSTGLLQPVRCCQRPDHSVLPWASSPPLTSSDPTHANGAGWTGLRLTFRSCSRASPCTLTFGAQPTIEGMT
jgi:hypothetical protein